MISIHRVSNAGVARGFGNETIVGPHNCPAAIDAGIDKPIGRKCITVAGYLGVAHVRYKRDQPVEKKTYYQKSSMVVNQHWSWL